MSILLIRSGQLISHTQRPKREREICENNLTLGVNGQGPKSGPMKNRPDFSQAGPPRCKTARGKDESVHSQKFVIPTNVQSKKKRNWNVKRKVGVGTIFLVVKLMDATSMARMARDPCLVNLFQNERITSNFFRCLACMQERISCKRRKV